MKYAVIGAVLALVACSPRPGEFTHIRLTEAGTATIEAGVRKAIRQNPEGAVFSHIAAVRGVDGRVHVCGLVTSDRSGVFIGTAPFVGTLTPRPKRGDISAIYHVDAPHKPGAAYFGCHRVGLIPGVSE